MLSKIIKYLFWAYLVVSLFIYIFYIPPFEKPDESLHFLRAVSVSQGNFICKTNKNNQIVNPIPASIYQYMQKKLGKLSNKKPSLRDDQNLVLQDKNKINEIHSCVLPFFYYLATGANIAIFRVFSISPEIIFYSGRLINTLLALLIIIFSLKGLLPAYQLISLYVFAWPMVLYQISSYSKDAYFIALGLYIFNRLLYVISHKVLKNSELIIFIISLIYYILARPPYIPFVLLLLAILTVRHNKSSERFNKILIFGTIATIISTLSFLIINNVYITPYNTNYGLSYYGQIDPILQLNRVIFHPGNYIVTFFQTIRTFFVFYIKSSIGIFGSLNKPLPNFIYAIFLLIGIIISFVVGLDHRIKIFTRLKYQLLLVTILTIAILFSAMYLYSSPIGSPLIYGIQGRYLINLVPLTILLLAILISEVKKSF
jgi:uncharacterized membrane protein